MSAVYVLRAVFTAELEPPAPAPIVPEAVTTKPATAAPVDSHVEPSATEHQEVPTTPASKHAHLPAERVESALPALSSEDIIAQQDIARLKEMMAAASRTKATRKSQPQPQHATLTSQWAQTLNNIASMQFEEGAASRPNAPATNRKALLHTVLLIVAAVVHAGVVLADMRAHHGTHWVGGLGRTLLHGEGVQDIDTYVCVMQEACICSHQIDPILACSLLSTRLLRWSCCCGACTQPLWFGHAFTACIARVLDSARLFAQLHRIQFVLGLAGHVCTFVFCFVLTLHLPLLFHAVF